MAGPSRRTEDFFVEFGSNAGAFSDKLRTELEGAHTEVELLDAALAQLDRNINSRGAAGKGSSMFANLAATVTEISKLPGSFRTIAGDLGSVVDALQGAVRKLGNVDLTTPRNIAAVGSDVTPAATPARKQAAKRTAKRTDAAAAVAQAAADDQAVASESTAAAAKRTATAAKKVAAAEVRTAEAQEETAQAVEKQAQAAERVAAKARTGPRRLKGLDGSVIQERTQEQIEQFAADSIERFNQFLKQKIGYSKTITSSSTEKEFDDAIKAVAKFQKTAMEVIEEATDQATAAQARLKASAAGNIGKGAAAAAPAAAPAAPARPTPTAAQQRTAPTKQEAARAVVAGLTPDQILSVIPKSVLANLAQSLGLGRQGSQTATAKAIAGLKIPASEAARLTSDERLKAIGISSRPKGAEPVNRQNIGFDILSKQADLQKQPITRLEELADVLGVSKAGGNKAQFASRIADALTAVRAYEQFMDEAADAAALLARETRQAAAAVSPEPGPAPAARPATPARPQPKPETQSDSQQALAAQRVERALGMDREAVKALPRPDLKGLAQALGVSDGGNQNQLAKRVNDQLDAARVALTAVTERATREALEAVGIQQDAAEATEDSADAQERVARAAQSLAITEGKAEEALEEMIQRVKRVGRQAPSAVNAARGRATAAANEAARLQGALDDGVLQNGPDVAAKIARQEQIRDDAMAIVNRARLTEVEAARDEYAAAVARQVAAKQSTSKGFGVKGLQAGLKLVGPEGVGAVLAARALPVTEGTNNPVTAAKRVVERLREQIVATLDNDADRIAASKALDTLTSGRSIDSLVRSTRGFEVPELGEVRATARQLMRDTLGNRPGAGLSGGLNEATQAILQASVQEIAERQRNPDLASATALVRRLSDRRAGAEIPENFREVAQGGSSTIDDARAVRERRTTYDLEGIASSNLLRNLIQQLRESPRRAFGTDENPAATDARLESLQRQLTAAEQSRNVYGVPDREADAARLRDEMSQIRATRGLPLGGGSDAPVTDLIRQVVEGFKRQSSALYPRGLAAAVAPGDLTGGVIAGQTGSTSRLPMNSAQLRYAQFANLTEDEVRKGFFKVDPNDPRTFVDQPGGGRVPARIPGQSTIGEDFLSASELLASEADTQRKRAVDIARTTLAAQPDFNPFTLRGLGLTRPGKDATDEERSTFRETIKALRPVQSAIEGADRYLVDLGDGIREFQEGLRTSTDPAQAEQFRQGLASLRDELGNVFGPGADLDALVAGARERMAVRAVGEAKEAQRKESARTGVDSLRKSSNDLAYRTGLGQNRRSLQNVGSTLRNVEVGASYTTSDGLQVPMAPPTMDDFLGRFPAYTPAQLERYQRLEELRRGKKNKRGRGRTGGIEGSLRSIGRAGGQLTDAEAALAASPDDAALQTKVQELRAAKAKADAARQTAIDAYAKEFDGLFGAGALDDLTDEQARQAQRFQLSPEEIKDRNRLAREQRQDYLDLPITPETSDRDRDIQQRAQDQQRQEDMLANLRRRDLTEASERVAANPETGDRGPITGLEDLLARGNMRAQFDRATQLAESAARGARGGVISQSGQEALAELIGATETGPTAEATRAAEEQIENLKNLNREDSERLATAQQATQVAGESLAELQAQRALLATQTARRAGAGRVNEETRMQEIYALDAALGKVDPSTRTGSTDANGNIIPGGIPLATDPREIRRLQERRDYLSRPTVQDKNARLKDLDDRIAALSAPQSERDNAAAEIAARMASREREIAASQKVLDAPKFALTTDEFREAERRALFQRSAAVAQAAEAQTDIPVAGIRRAAGGSIERLDAAVDAALATGSSVRSDAAARAKDRVADAVEDVIEGGARQGAAEARATLDSSVNTEIPGRLSPAELASAARDASDRSAASLKALAAADRLSEDLGRRQAGETEGLLKDRTRSTLRNTLQRFVGDSTGDLNDDGFASLIDKARGQARSVQGGLNHDLVALGDSISKQLVAGGGGGGPIDVRVVSFGTAAASTLNNLKVRLAQPAVAGDTDGANAEKPTRTRRRATRPAGPPTVAEQPDGPRYGPVRQESVRDLYEKALETSQGNLLAAQAEPELTADKLRQIRAGTVDPVTVGKDGSIEDGFHRIAAAVQGGIETLPVRDLLSDTNAPSARRTSAEVAAAEAQAKVEREARVASARDAERANLPGNIGQLLTDGNALEAARQLTREGYRTMTAIGLVKRQLALSGDEAQALKTQLQAAAAADRKAGRKEPKSAAEIAQEEAEATASKARRENAVRAARAAERASLPQAAQDALNAGDGKAAARALIDDPSKSFKQRGTIDLVGRQLGLDAGALEDVRADLQTHIRLTRQAERAAADLAETTRRQNEALASEEKRLADVARYMDSFTDETQQAIIALQRLIAQQREFTSRGQAVPGGLQDQLRASREDVFARANAELTGPSYIDGKGRQQKQIPGNVRAVRLRQILGTTGPETGEIRDSVAAGFNPGNMVDGLERQRSGFEAALFGNGGFFGRLFATGGAFVIREFAGNFIFGISNIVQESFRQALATEAEFVRISNGLETLDAPQGEVNELRASLSTLSTDLGVPLAEAFSTASQLVGVFETPAEIAFATKAVKELEIISNGALGAKEGVQSLAAAQEAFSNTEFEFKGAAGMQALVDLTTQIQNLTGVNIEDQLEGLATLGPQAQALGLDPTSALLIPGLAAKRTGQTGDVAAEQVSRIFSSLQGGAGKEALIEAGIDRALIDNQQFAEIYKKLLEGIASGAIDKTQVQNLVNAAGPKQARAFQAILQNPADTLNVFAKATESAGAGAERVEEIMRTLGRQIKVLREGFTNLIVNLIAIGAFDAFGVLIVGTNKMLGLLNDLLVGFNAFNQNNPFFDFITRATFVALGFAVILRALGIGATAFRDRIAAFGVTGSPGGGPAAAAAAAARANATSPVMTGGRVVGGPASNSGPVVRGGQVMGIGIGGTVSGGVPVAGAGVPLRPGATWVQAGALAGGVGGIRGAAQSGLGAARAGRFGSNLALGTAGTLTRFVGNMGIATQRMDRVNAALQRFQANTVLAATASKRSAVLQGAASGLFTAALIALPFLITAIQQRSQRAKDVDERTKELFGEEPQTAAEKRRAESQTFTEKIVEGETGYFGSLGETYTSGKKLLGGTLALPETLVSTLGGLGSLLTGNGFSSGYDKVDSKLDFFLADKLLEDPEEDAAEASGSEAVARLRARVKAQIEATSGSAEQLNMTMEEIDAEARRILSDPNLSVIDKAYLQDELQQVEEYARATAKNIRQNLLQLADADLLTSGQLTAVSDVLNTAASLTPQAREKYGSQIFQGEVNADRIAPGSAIGEIQRILLGAPTASEYTYDLEAYNNYGMKPIIDPKTGKPPVGPDGKVLVGEGDVDKYGNPVGMDLEALANKPSLTDVFKNPEKFPEFATLNAGTGIVPDKMSLAERQKKARTALEALIEQLNAELIGAEGDPDEEERIQTELSQAISLWNDLNTQILNNAVASTRAMADLLINRNDNKGAISQLKQNTQALKDQLQNLEIGSAEAIANLAEQDANSRRIAELQNESGPTGFNAQAIEAARTRDPVAAAAINLRIAEKRLKTAKDTPGYAASDIRDLEIAVIQAQIAAGDLATAVADSATALASAVAQAAGDNVEVARIALDAANTKLQEAIDDKLGEAEINTRRATAVQAQGQFRDAVISETMSDLDFGFEMGNLSQNAYISGLQNLLKRNDLTKQQRQDIERKIKGLQDDLRQELTGSGFNIPDAIKLPTAYEVRRSLGMNPIGAPAPAGAVNTTNVTNNTQVNNTVSSPAMVEAVAQRVVDLIATQTATGARANQTPPALVRY